MSTLSASNWQCKDRSIDFQCSDQTSQTAHSLTPSIYLCVCFFSCQGDSGEAGEPGLQGDLGPPVRRQTTQQPTQSRFTPPATSTTQPKYTTPATITTQSKYTTPTITLKSKITSQHNKQYVYFTPKMLYNTISPS